MKNVLSMRLLQFLAALCLLSVIPAKADQFGDFTYTATAPVASVTGYTGAGGVVTIPETINGLSVTSIGLNAFRNKTSLTSVTIPGSVTSIGSYAFSGCTGLTSVTIPNSVTSIGSEAFRDCTGLISVTIPNSVTTIEREAFYGCTGLTSLTIGSGVTSIGDNAFAACTGLSSVTIGSGVTSIGSGMFQLCIRLTSVTIPNSVTSIGDFAFYNCTSLTSLTVDAANPNYSSMAGVLFNKNQTSLIQYPQGKTGIYTIPNSVTSIGRRAFRVCTGLTSVTIPGSVTSIGSEAFKDCTGLTSVTIPNSVTTIGGSAFQDCTGLTSVTIGSGVTSIESQAFQGCTGLTSVTIGSGATSIGTSAFLTCPNLLSIYIKGNAPALGTTVFTSNSKSNVYYRSGTTGWTSTYGGLSTVALGLPTITGQPSSVIANAGENAAFSVIAKTTFPLTLSYQWQRNGLIIPGATAESLYLSSIQSANVGTYTVIISNDIGSVSSAVTLTLTQGNLYTQAQFDSGLQAGLNAGMAVGMATGRAQVTDSPNSYGLYSLSQVQALHVGTPLLAKDSATGKFKLTIGVEKSTNLVNFSPMAIPVGAATINPQGKMEFEFTASDNAAFFRIESR